MINMQKQLMYITKLLVTDFNLPKLRGIIAIWRQADHTACISFYFDGPITEHDQDEVDDLSAGIIAHFSDGLLEDKIIRLDKPNPLPESPFWAYKQPERGT